MNDITGNGAPIFYNHVNAIASTYEPGTIHAHNAGLTRYFARYLMQKAISVFDFALPKNWAKEYFLYVLYSWGYVAVVNTDIYGVIPQGCSLRGYDVFYRPTNAVITNPLLRGIKTPEIGKECTLIKLQPDYGGIYDIVSYYADMLAVCAETIGTNLINTKLSYIFGCDNQRAANSFKKMFDEIASGQPAVFVDKGLFNDEGEPAWFTFSQNLKENYIAADVLGDMRKIECMFDTEIGIPNANTDKRERLISDEVNSNNFEVKSKCALWLDQLKDGLEETREMFQLTPQELAVEWRKLPEQEAGNESDT